MSEEHLGTLQEESLPEMHKSLRAAATEIDLSLQEYGCSMSKMVEVVTGASRSIGMIQEELREGESITEMKDVIGGHVDGMEKQLKQAIICMQFYDQLVQRLRYIQEILRAIDLVTLEPNKENTDLLHSLHAKLRSVYSSVQTKYICDSMLEDCPQNFTSEVSLDGNDVELF